MSETSKREQLLEAEVARLKQENELLREKVDLLIRKIFGKSSEQLDDNQLMLLLGGEEEPPKKPESDGQEEQEAEPSPQDETKGKTPRKPRQSRSATLPKDIAVEESEIIPEEVAQNPELYREVGEEVTEKLDFTPAQFKKLVIRRKKFAKRFTDVHDPARDHLYIAPLPPSLKERSLLTPNLAAEIATNRFCYHLPYYRQEQMFLTHHRVHLPRNTMSQWMSNLAHDYLSGIYRAMHEEMLQSTYLQADETTIDYIKPGSGETQKGYLWVLSQPDPRATRRGTEHTARGDIFFQWHEGRGAKYLEELLKTETHRFIGTLQCDAYKAYVTYQQSMPALLTLLACLAHIRRKFYDARKRRPKLSGWFLRQIRHLYAIEADLRQRRAGPTERERVRQLEARPIYNRIKKALEVFDPKRTEGKMRPESRKISPESNLGKALTYALNNWERLEPYLHDGCCEIDNNLVENGIRPTKLGAKNWLFMGSTAAGQTNAIWYTLTESCRRRKLDPWKYFAWIFTELPKLKVTTKDIFTDYTPKAYNQSLRNVTPKKAAA